MVEQEENPKREREGYRDQVKLLGEVIKREREREKQSKIKKLASGKGKGKRKRDSYESGKRQGRRIKGRCRMRREEVVCSLRVSLHLHQIVQTVLTSKSGQD